LIRQAQPLTLTRRNSARRVIVMLELPFETRRVNTGQVTLECLTAGAGGERVAILLHGFPEAHFSWRHQIGLLASEGYEVWAPNQRGYGASDRPSRVADYHVEKLVADVAGLIDLVAAGRPVTLMAHDWGAIVAWVFAIKAMRPLERLVVMNVPHPAVFAEVARSKGSDQLRRSWYVFFFQLPWLPEVMMTARGAEAIGKAFHDMAVDKTQFTPDVLAAYKANALIPGAMTAMINWYRANFRGNAMHPYRREVVPRIEVPTLMVWGEEDTALSIELTEGYGGLVTDFTLRRLPGVSHWAQQEAPEAVNAILLDWLGTGVTTPDTPAAAPAAAPRPRKRKAAPPAPAA
jgi:epoxide hydrolase 4